MKSSDNSQGQRQTIKLAVAIGLLVVTAWFLFRAKGNGPRIESVYFYDVGSGELYSEAVETSPPTTAPSGSEGVRAFVFACNDCDDASDRFIGYLRKFSDAYVSAVKSGNPEIPAEVIMAANLVRITDDQRWFVTESPRGQAILTGPQQRCESQTPQECLP